MDPDLRKARVGVCIVFAICGAAFATWAARIPAVQERLGLSTGELGLGLFALAAGSVIALLAAGPLIVTIGSRAGAMIGAVVLCAGLPVIAFAPGKAWFVAALFVLGVGNSVLDVSMNAHAARVEQEYGRPIFAGFHAFWNIGGLVGSGAGAALEAVHVPITVHFPWAAVLLLAIGAFATLRLFRTGPDQGQGASAFALPSKALIPLGVIAFCGFLAEGTVNDWSAVYLSDVTAAPAAVTSLGYFAFSFAMIGVRLVADRATDRVGIVALVRVVTVITLAGFALVTLVPVPAVAIIGFAVVGVGVSAVVPLAWSSASRMEPHAPSRAVAAVATCGYLGFLAGPVVISVLEGAVGLRLAVACAGALMVLVYVLAPTMRVPVAAR
ncbi:MFS transporter [Pseudonocardia sp. TRM90224]|uniref:MFS transporter n=1 Tax=Pseudonocardia sp. TRM90224 TaxID=2812678 RepID=UPI001E426FEB|nr:MFS transporter [Pseudonocardia sp. TRM90224]